MHFPLPFPFVITGQGCFKMIYIQIDLLINQFEKCINNLIN